MSLGHCGVGETDSCILQDTQDFVSHIKRSMICFIKRQAGFILESCHEHNYLNAIEIARSAPRGKCRFVNTP